MATSILGKLTPFNTPIHRLDSRLKMFGLVVFMVIIFLPFGNYTNRFIFLGVITLLILLLMLVARVSFIGFLKNLKSMWFMIFFLVLIMFFVPSTGLHPIHTFANGYTLYFDGLLQVGHVILRLVLMVALTVILTSTTAPMDITYALEWYLTPLKLLKFPTQVVSMTISLALRFIPTLLDESQRIMNAQKSRGVDYNRGFISKKIRSITTLIVPLLVSCFSRSDELATAMDARGYDPYASRTRYKILKFTYQDLIAILTLLIILGGFIAISVLSSNLEGFNDIINFIWGIQTL